MKTLKISGKKATKESDLVNFDPLDLGFEPLQLIEVSSIRGDSTLQKIEGEEDDIVDLIMEDGMEWIGPLGDIKEIYNSKLYHKREQIDEDELPTSLIYAQDRDLKEWAIKAMGLFVQKSNVTQIVAEELGEWVDKKIMKFPGIYSVKKNFDIEKAKIQKSGDPILLFLHGTISSTLGSFDKLYQEQNTKAWKKIWKKYKNDIYALEHRTVSVSPLENAIDFLKNVPEGCKIDIISHSRGGIVADILSRCDHRNEDIGFSPQEIKVMLKEDKILSSKMKELNDLATVKKITVRKVIRVASPAAGTVLLSDRLDHYLNGILNSIRLLMGGPVGELYGIVKSFLMGVIKNRMTPDTLPGLLAMVPGSTFQKIINKVDVEVEGDLYVIEGNSEIGGRIGHSLLVILSNLFYRAANDFVVNTSSMIYGVRRKRGVQYFLSEDSDTTHFNYFKNENTQKAIQSAIATKVGSLDNQYVYLDSQDSQRGLVDLFVKMGEVKPPRNTKDRPTVILIPGIMGTNLFVNDRKIWVDFSEISNGKIKDELHLQSEVKAQSLIGKFYQKFAHELNKTHDVALLPFDWRLPVEDAAEELKELIEGIQKENTHPIKIVAHSMGGLVVRSYMMKYKDLWVDLNESTDFKYLMLGTPWYGSHLIMEVITGHSRRVKQLALLDFPNSKRDLMKVFNTYDGIYQLLPLKGTDFEDKSFWSNLNDKLGGDEFDIPDSTMLDRFRDYKAEIFGSEFKFDNTYYLAGKEKGTTFAYEVKKNIFGKKLRYHKTPLGDGSVTWELGIPKDLDSKRIYYCETSHGDLANDSDLFPGIFEILTKGTTELFDKEPIVSRGEDSYIDYENDLLSNDPLEALEIIFGGNMFKTRAKAPLDLIEVKVTHGDLKFADYPVMVGHFKQDGIVSAESYLNWCIGNKLSNRHQLGIYPGKIGDSLFVFDKSKKPKGALIIGLGEPTDMTTFNLKKAVESGIINYVMSQRDNNTCDNLQNPLTGITSLFIGSYYGQLPLETSINAILEGITQANLLLKDIDEKITRITHVEFLDYYEDIAQEAYYKLKKIDTFKSSSYKIKVRKGIERKSGRRKRFPFQGKDIWWMNMRTTFNNSGKKPYLSFSLARGIARVEDEQTFTSQFTINTLLKELSTKSAWEPKLSKTLFELIIPNNFKEVIRTQNNIVWRMDVHSASYPWEMFHDINYDKDPTFVRAGLIRQLITEDYRLNPMVIKTKTALVIGDPIYRDSKLPQLPGARREARMVSDLLNDAGFETTSEIGKSGVENLISITNLSFKVLHMAGHGIYYKPDEKDDSKPESKEEIGVVLGNGIILSAIEIGNLPVVPEFVFINCCHSGEMNPSLEKYYQDRYKLAANIGTQLIKDGVEAAVIAGWAVNDGAAETFASVLYSRMLDGYNFGDAVTHARKACYDQHSKTNTWGAYQCYGDPFYRLTNNSGNKSRNDEYILEEEVMIDLENLFVDSSDRNKQSEEDTENIITSLNEVIQRAINSGFYSSYIMEWEARIYLELNKQEVALEKYGLLMKQEDANFRLRSVEHFVNILVKYTAKQGSANRAETKKIEKYLDLLGDLGKTSERLSIIGSGYKRMAILSTQRYKKGFLKKMEESYWLAYLKIYENTIKSIYSLSNFLCAKGLLQNMSLMSLFEKEFSATQLIGETLSKLKKGKREFSDFWDEVAFINLYICQILFSENEEEIGKLTQSIIDDYEEIFKHMGSQRNLGTEVEHLDFLIDTWSDEDEDIIKIRVKAFEKVKGYLEKL